MVAQGRPVETIDMEDVFMELTGKSIEDDEDMEEDARRELAIQPAGPVLLLAAANLSERRKGAEILPQLWQHIEQRPLTRRV